jgi:hypothetical protein
MELVLYYRLGTKSKRALARQKTSWGNLYTYRPRGDLLERLSRETGLSIKEVTTQLHKERYEILRSGVVP